MKKLIIWLIVIMAGMLFVKTDLFDQVRTDGFSAFGDFADQVMEEYSTDAIGQRMSDSMKIDEAVRDYKRKVGKTKETAQAFYYGYCVETSQAHEELNDSQLEKVCEYAEGVFQPSQAAQ